MRTEAAIPFVIHIVDDDAQMRAATSFALAGHGYKTQIYASIEELLGERRLQNGCALLKSGMLGPGALELFATLEERGGSISVIVVGENTPATAAVGLLRQGAVDFLERPYAESELIAAVERAIHLSRERVLHRQRRAAARTRLAMLSPRKLQVLQGLAAGMSNKVIARHLAISPRTVEIHRASMMEDLGVESLAEALRMAMDAELALLEEAPLQTLGSGPISQGPAVEGADDEQSCSLDRAVVFPSVIELLEGTTDCVFLLDAEWRFTYLNANARKVLGGGDELLGISVWDKYPLACATRAWEELHRAAIDRQATRFEFYQPDLRAWLDVSVRPYKGGLQVSFRNVSAEKRSTAQLELSEETLRHTLEAAGDGAWDWNIQTGEIAMSSAFLDRLGYGLRAFPQTFDSFVQLVHPDDLSTLTRCLKDHLDGCSSGFRCEYRLRRFGGGWLWNLDRGRVVSRDPVTGLPLRMVGTANDITHIKEAHQRAEEAFGRLSLVQASAGVGLWELDLKTHQLLFCEQSRRMHGLPADGQDALTEEDWLEAVHPDDRDPAKTELERHIENGQSYRIRYRTLGPDGAIRWVLGMGKAVLAGNGRPARFAGLNIDITGLSKLAGTEDRPSAATG